jgi:hypothetical protein
MMKSFRSKGSPTADRMSRKKVREPWKKSTSVSTDRQLAPAASYSRAMATGSKSGRMTPLLGEAFFTSAMTILQETVEAERQGRVFGFVGIVISVAMPIGMSVLGPLADVFPVESLLVAAGATQIIAVGLAVMLPAGRRAVKAARASSEANSQTPEAQPAD